MQNHKDLIQLHFFDDDEWIDSIFIARTDLEKAKQIVGKLQEEDNAYDNGVGGIESKLNDRGIETYQIESTDIQYF